MNEGDGLAWAHCPIIATPFPEFGNSRFVDRVDRIGPPKASDIAPSDALVLLGLRRLGCAACDLGIQLLAPVLNHGRDGMLAHGDTVCGVVHGLTPDAHSLVLSLCRVGGAEWPAYLALA